MPDREQITYEVDPRQVLEAFKRMNAAAEEFEKKAGTTNERFQRELENLGATIIKVNDRSRQSQDALARSYERQAAAFGKTPIEKANQQFEQLTKRLGDNKTAIDRVTQAHAALIQKMKEEEALNSGGHGINARYAFFAAKDIAEGRTKYAAAEAANLLTTLKGAPVIIGGVALAFAGLGVSAVSAAKSLGTYAVEVNNIREKTGLSGQEVEQFRYAFKVAGQDIGSLDRITRGMTQALEDNTKQGERARDAMQKLGVETLDYAGNARPMSQVLLEVSDNLNKISDPLARDKVALDLFKRSGIETIPVVMSLSKNVQDAKALGLGPSDAELNRWLEYNRQIAELDAKWQEHLRTLKQWLVYLLEGAAALSTVARVAASIGSLSNLRSPAPAAKNDYDMSLTTPVLDTLQRLGQGTRDASARTRLQSTLSSGLEGQQDKLGKLRQDYQEAVVESQRLVQQQGVGAAALDAQDQKLQSIKRAYVAQEELVKGIQKAESERRSNLEAMQSLLQKARDLSKREPGYSSPMENALEEFGRRPGTGIPAMLEQLRKSPEVLAAFAKELDDVGKKFNKFARELGDTTGAKLQKESLSRLLGDVRLWAKDYEDATKAMEERNRIVDKTVAADRVMRESQEESRAKIRAAVSLDHTSRGEMRRATEDAEIKQKYLKEAYDYELAEVDRLAKYTENVDEKRTELRLQYEKNVSDLQIELANKAAEIQGKQLKDLQTSLESLYTTLFTKPQDFGKQLGSTVKAATLKPITEGLASVTAQAIYPIIYGRTGQGGISGSLHGIFGGGAASTPVIVSTDANTLATNQNTAALYAHAASVTSGGIASLTGGGGGGGVTSIPLPFFGGGGGTAAGYGGGGGNTGISLPFFGGGFGGGNPASMLGPGGTSGFAGPIGGFGGGGMGVGGGGGFGGLLGGLRGLFSGNTLGGLEGNLSAMMHPGTYSTLGGQTGALGTFGNLATGPFAGTSAAGLGGLGFGLALHGLTGDSAGSVGGLVQGAAGGFLAAGPIGAAIGAGIGLGEILAGVEPKWKEAERLVKSTYGITIPKETGQQIAQIAVQRYGGRVSIAVRSPEVRQMLGLFAAGTGQSMDRVLSSLTPRAGSITMSGGTLYQESSYLYGNAYTYQSNLPVLGAQPGGTWPGGSPQSVSLNINGQSAADLLEGRVASVVTPSYISSGYQTAQYSSDGRVQGAANAVQPGLLSA